LTIFEHDFAIHENILDSLRCTEGMVVRGTVADPLGIEDHDIGVIPFPEEAAALEMKGLST
jgi:hypothetical protein